MFDLAALDAALRAHGAVARIVVAGVEGSAPREVGAALLVWAGGSRGTIGGGALEWEAIQRARALLAEAGQGRGRLPPPAWGRDGEGGTAADPDARSSGSDAPHPHPLPTGGRGGDISRRGALAARVDRLPLGPALGQCCGGAVTLVTEVFTPDSLPEPEPGGVIARSVDGRPMPLAVKRLLARARGQGVLPAPVLLQGWMIEPVARPSRAIWVWGAGHVGRALVAVLAPLPGLAITWVDVAPDRFPADIPGGVTALHAADPGSLVAGAPAAAEHLVLTFSHALDLELCHRLLSHGFAGLGLIGSATKWARFRSRLAALGHAPAAIARITCPIGDPALGKHPQAIAIGVAGMLLKGGATIASRQETAG